MLNWDVNRVSSIKNNRKIIYLISFISLISVNCYLYSFGYRLTADEVSFDRYSMDGMASILRFSYNLSIAQGRIGQNIITLINVFTSVYSEYFYMRIFFAFVFFSSYILFFYYISKIFEKNITIPLSVTMMAVCPLLFHHTAPTSYPLQNTLPFAILTVIRIIKFRKEIKNPIFILLYVIFSISSEYATLFAICLYIIDYTSILLINKSSLISIIRSCRFKIDSAIIIFTLSIYFIFRFIHPSNYDGNSVSGTDISDTIYVAILHVWNGTIFPNIITEYNYEKNSTGIAIIVAALSYVSIIPYLKDNFRKNLSLLIIFIMISCTIVVVFPVTATPKMQNWCLVAGDCIFLSSRSALYFIVPAIYISYYFIIRSEIMRGVLLASIAALGSAHNVYIANKMSDYVLPFERVISSPCTIQMDKIDPKESISMHPGFDRTEYWKSYLQQNRIKQGCDHQ